MSLEKLLRRTVKQSFSHGRVKSVAVEVKKVRTFDKNSSSQIQRADWFIKRSCIGWQTIRRNKSFISEEEKVKLK